MGRHSRKYNEDRKAKKNSSLAAQPKKTIATPKVSAEITNAVVKSDDRPENGNVSSPSDNAIDRLVSKVESSVVVAAEKGKSMEEESVTDPLPIEEESVPDPLPIEEESVSDPQLKPIANVEAEEVTEPGVAVEKVADVEAEGVEPIAAAGGRSDSEGSKRKSYSRSCLLNILRSTSLERPVLPNLQIVLRFPHGLLISNDGCGRHPNGQNAGGRQDRCRFEAERKVSLNTSENAWKPSHKAQCNESKELLMKQMQAVLNKLTPEKFDVILEQVKLLPIDDLEKLQGCVKLLFEKALLEPKFSACYAKMALCWSRFSVRDASSKDPISSRSLLLRECQKEFEKDKKDEKVFSEMDEKIKLAKTPEEKRDLSLERDMYIFTAKRRSLGNVIFIGELFKLNMLSEAIVIQCLSKLVQKHDDEESMECLCNLLKTIGQLLDSKSKPKVDALFNELKRFVETNGATSTRIRFMMMDVMDLRAAGWTSKNEGPKTIAQVHRDVETEKQKHSTSNHERPARLVPKPFAPANAHHQHPQNFHEHDRQRHRGRPDRRISGFHDNRFNNNINNHSIHNNNNNNNINNHSIHNNNNNINNHSIHNNNRNNRQFGFRNDRSYSRNKTNEIAREAPKPKPEIPVEKPMSREDMEVKVKSRIDEYLSIKDIQEALETVKELKTDVCFTNAVRFFYVSLSQYLERSAKERHMVGQLHGHMLEKKIAPVEAYYNAWIKFSKLANEMIVDIPQVWNYVSEFLTPVVSESSVFDIKSLATTSDLVDPELDENFGTEDDCTAMLLASVLNGASAGKGEQHAASIWSDSGLDWRALVKHSSPDDFLKRYLM